MHYALVKNLMRTSKRDFCLSAFTMHRHHHLTFTTDHSEKPKASPFEIAEVLSPARAERESSDSFANGGVKVGDFVVVRYNDTNKLRRIFLSDTENKPEDGIVHVDQPLGVAVLGAEVDDEIQFPHGKGTRSAVIERIERGVH